MDLWSIERRIKQGETEFHFTWGGNLDDFKALVLLIRQEFGATIKNRSDCPYATTLTIGLPDHDITLFFDGGYEMIFFSPVNEHDVELAQAFANELQKMLNQGLGPRR